jgi:mevalonate kinase
LTVAHAPGKVILLGEHSVVYGRPAIAVPVTEVKATALVEETRDAPGVTVCAEDIGCTIDVAQAPPEEPLGVTVRNVLGHLGVGLEDVRLTLTLHSTIPVASGMGSGAAVATAIVRALSAHLGYSLAPAIISSIVYETEKIYHGTPSGIDNTVVAFAQPVYFCRGQPIEAFAVRRPFWIAIADTGVPSLTKETVADVCARRERDPVGCEGIFDQIGALVDEARGAIEGGDIEALGPLMVENQRLLCALDVSLPELEVLIGAALRAGAFGAKLSGGGRGGNMIALLDPSDAKGIEGALFAAGAKNVITTEVG